MYGDLLRLLELTVCAKHYMRTREILMVDKSYINSLQFSFLPQKRFLSGKRTIVYSVKNWMRELVGRELRQICFGGSFLIADSDTAKFSDTVPDWTIFCRYATGSSLWVIHQEFNQSLKRWDVICTEREAPYIEAAIENPKEKFLETLEDIKILADKLGEPGFAQMFARAAEYLSGKKSVDLKFPMMPEENQRLFAAAQKAYVFGGMGSWQEMPLIRAIQMWLEEKYTSLTMGLYEHVLMACAYSVNIW